MTTKDLSWGDMEDDRPIFKLDLQTFFIGGAVNIIFRGIGKLFEIDDLI